MSKPPPSSPANGIPSGLIDPEQLEALIERAVERAIERVTGTRPSEPQPGLIREATLVLRWDSSRATVARMVAKDILHPVRITDGGTSKKYYRIDEVMQIERNGAQPRADAHYNPPPGSKFGKPRQPAAKAVRKDSAAGSSRASRARPTVPAAAQRRQRPTLSD
jgi:hypothetical protein